VGLLLIRRVESFMQRTRMRPTTFGRLAVRDPRLVYDLRRGRILRPLTRMRVEAFLDRMEQELGDEPWPRRR
jgi:hypothetical protein